MDTPLAIASAFLLVAVAAFAVVTSEGDRRIRRLLLAGLALHVAGSLLYLAIIGGVYGSGDFQRYFGEGLWVASRLETGGPAAGFEVFAIYRRNFGTPAVSFVAGWQMYLLGPSLMGLFVTFAVAGWTGTALMCAAFRRAFPRIEPYTYYAWTMLMPSLWFWTSPLGKDALVMLGVGMVAYGVTLRYPLRSYALMAAGIALTFFIRPQYALVTLVAFLAGMVLGKGGVQSPVLRAATVLAIAVGGIFTAQRASDALGFEVTDAEETSEFIEVRSEGTAYGGSAFDAATNPASGLFNVLFRPFPWEASGVTMLASSLEVLLLWFLLFRRRRAIAAFLRVHWRDPLVMISIAFVVVLGAAVGMAVGNFGTLVRQRVFIYPFLFVFAAALPGPRARLRRARRRAPSFVLPGGRPVPT